MDRPRMKRSISGRRRSAALLNLYLQAAIDMDRMDLVDYIETHQGMSWKIQHLLVDAIPKKKHFLLRRNINPEDRVTL